MINSLFRQSNFRSLWIGRLVSIFGDRFSELALPWLVLQSTHSPWKAGLVVACEQVAPLILATPIGVWAEGRPKRKTVVVAEFFRFLAMMLITILAWRAIVSVWIIALALFAMGTAGAFWGSSYSFLIRTAVGRENLGEAYNLIEGADAVSTLAGPLVAGWVFITLGPAWALAIDAMSYLVSLWSVAFLPKSEPELDHHKRKSVSFVQGFHSAVDGFKFIGQSRLLRMLLAVGGLLNFITLAMQLLIIILAQQKLHMNAGQTGILFATMGAADLLGVFVMNKLHRRNWRILLAMLLAVSSGGILLIALSRNFYWAIFGTFFFDGALSMGFVVSASSTQRLIPQNQLARFNSTSNTLSSSMRFVSRLYSGGVAQYVTVRFAIGFCAALLLGGVWWLLRYRGNEDINVTNNNA
jgi:MFS family permease